MITSTEIKEVKESLQYHLDMNLSVQDFLDNGNYEPTSREAAIVFFVLTREGKISDQVKRYKEAFYMVDNAIITPQQLDDFEGEILNSKIRLSSSTLRHVALQEDSECPELSSLMISRGFAIDGKVLNTHDTNLLHTLINRYAKTSGEKKIRLTSIIETLIRIRPQHTPKAQPELNIYHEIRRGLFAKTSADLNKPPVADQKVSAHRPRL